VDRVERGCASVPLDIEGEMRQRRHSFVGVSASSSFLESHHHHLID